MDANGDGIISFDEHKKYFNEHLAEEQNEHMEQYIKEYYTYLDINEDGTLTIQEYKDYFLA